MPTQKPLIEWTDEELQNASAYLAARIMELNRIKQDKKDAMTRYKHEIDEIENEILQLSVAVHEQNEPTDTRHDNTEIEISTSNHPEPIRTTVGTLKKLQREPGV